MANERRLIDANDLWSDIMMLPHNGDMISSEEVEQEIVDAPTVDAVEVVHGRWVHHYYDSGEPIDDKWYCSECHMCNDHKRTWYCPNCGAKMDGERKDNGC